MCTMLKSKDREREELLNKYGNNIATDYHMIYQIYLKTNLEV